MDKPARPFRNLRLSAVALCLAATFGFSVSMAQSVDRVNRQQQRSRVQRHPRQRICPTVGQEPSALHSAFVKTYHLADPPAMHVSESIRPVFEPAELIILPVVNPPGETPSFPSVLPRPPPSFA